jgi:hypothetical protein
MTIALAILRRKINGLILEMRRRGFLEMLDENRLISKVVHE